MNRLALSSIPLLAGCLGPMPPPPTLGYGAPYQGTGEKITVIDSRTDWRILEGKRPMSSEQALEASHDTEYETRRQIMKAHNATLYKQALRHRKLGYMMIGVAAATFVGGLIVSYGVAPGLATKDTTPATMDMPEMQHVTASGASNLAALIGTIGIWGGLAGMGYGYYGAWHKPDYVPWHTPRDLDRPAYVDQPVDVYNEEIDAKVMHKGAADQPAVPPANELRPPPGVRPPAQLPHPRGGRR